MPGMISMPENPYRRQIRVAGRRADERLNGFQREKK
jgi:hypothetical protein